jgi:hypothetical protein
MISITRLVCVATLAAMTLTTSTLCRASEYDSENGVLYQDLPESSAGSANSDGAETAPDRPVPKFIPPEIPNPWENPQHWLPVPGLPRPMDGTPWRIRPDVESTDEDYRSEPVYG